MPFFYADQVSEYIRDRLDQYKSEIGLVYVGLSDEMVPEFPACLILPGPVTRELHATHQWQVELRVSITVFHADANVDRSTRTIEDIQLANGVVKNLHKDIQLGGNIIHGWVESDTPGVIESPSRSVIVTLISWVGITRQNFTEGG